MKKEILIFFFFKATFLTNETLDNFKSDTCTIRSFSLDDSSIISYRCHCGIVDKSLALYPGVPRSIPDSSSLSNVTRSASSHDLCCWWDVKHKITHSQFNIQHAMYSNQLSKFSPFSMLSFLCNKLISLRLMSLYAYHIYICLHAALTFTLLSSFTSLPKYKV